MLKTEYDNWKTLSIDMLTYLEYQWDSLMNYLAILSSDFRGLSTVLQYMANSTLGNYLKTATFPNSKTF